MACVREAVVLLEEQPVLFLGVHERPAATQLATAQKHRQLALLDALTHQHLGPLTIETWFAFVFGGIDTRVPDDDLAATVFAFRDDPFECPVVERVILGHDRQPPFAVPVGRPIRNRPRLQDAIGFQAKVVVQPPRGVLLHNERQRPAANLRLRRWGRLRRTRKVALGAVLLERAHTPTPQLTGSTMWLTPATIMLRRP